jgi:hypothetical protein
VLPERCNAHQGQHEANDLGCLQTMRSPAGAATGERHEQHIPACSIDGQKQAAEQDQGRSQKPHGEQKLT